MNHVRREDEIEERRGRLRLFSFSVHHFIAYSLFHFFTI